jgi:hypothetical protein
MRDRGLTRVILATPVGAEIRREFNTSSQPVAPEGPRFTSASVAAAGMQVALTGRTRPEVVSVRLP